MPASYGLSFYRGDTQAWQFVLWQDALQTQPYDLTGMTPKAEIRDRPSGSTIVPLTLVISLPNIIDASLDAEHSSQCPLAGVWDLQLTNIDGDVITVLAGTVTVTADVTDSTPQTGAVRVRLAA